MEPRFRVALKVQGTSETRVVGIFDFERGSRLAREGAQKKRKEEVEGRHANAVR